MFLAIHFAGMLFVSCFKLQRTKVFWFWNSFGTWEAYVFAFVMFFFSPRICYDFVIFCYPYTLFLLLLLRDCDGRYEFMDKTISLDGFKHPRLHHT
jgi:hypothetical protein